MHEAARAYKRKTKKTFDPQPASVHSAHAVDLGEKSIMQMYYSFVVSCIGKSKVSHQALTVATSTHSELV
eukprot:g83224.t1